MEEENNENAKTKNRKNQNQVCRNHAKASSKNTYICISVYTSVCKAASRR